ncbi:GNAT family N-acetyltransferase [Chryseobacterium sp. MYb328]|uniref:GNAT family N-acetyltransferase n=1 Tax=Chryseobacterium sp. MYb328 TaxID=2745231 RepID=UPI0030AFFF37
MQERTILEGHENIKYHFKSFNELYELALDGDYEPWYSMEYWDETFIPFFILEDTKVIANVSVAPMNMVLKGQNYYCLQIGSVMTHPEYRNQGLSKYLMNYVMEKYKDQYEFFYLFANETVLDFYPKFGFTRVDESDFILRDTTNIHGKKSDWQPLSINDPKHISLMEKFSKVHASLSNTIDFSPNSCLAMYHFLLQFDESIYYSAEKECIVIMEYDKEMLRIYDILSTKLFNLEEIVSTIILEETQQIQFFFVPDTDFGGKLEVKLNPFDEDALHIFPQENRKLFPKHFIFPLTSHY